MYTSLIIELIQTCPLRASLPLLALLALPLRRLVGTVSASSGDENPTSSTRAPASHATLHQWWQVVKASTVRPEAQRPRGEALQPLVHEDGRFPGVRTPENTRGTSQKRLTSALIRTPMRGAVTRTLYASIHETDTVY
jgi:hypothetical protein